MNVAPDAPQEQTFTMAQVQNMLGQVKQRTLDEAARKYDGILEVIRNQRNQALDQVAGLSQQAADAMNERNEAEAKVADLEQRMTLIAAARDAAEAKLAQAYSDAQSTDDPHEENQNEAG